MKRLHITLTVEFGTPKDEPQGADPLDALVDHGNPDPHPRHELDGRRPIGFGETA